MMQKVVGTPFYHHLYDEIRIENYAERITTYEDYDVIIFGDSLEHQPPDVAEHVLAVALEKARTAVIVSGPVVLFPQGEFFGNTHEMHRTNFSRELLESFGGFYLGGNATVAAFGWKIPDWERSERWQPLRLEHQINGPRFDSQAKLRYTTKVEPTLNKVC